MSDFILEYECLESIVHYSKALGKRAEEYSEGLESKIISGIGNVTGGASGYLIQAADSVRDKIRALKQKSDAFNSFAEEVTNLLEVAEQMDQEVADAIAGQGEYSPEHHKSNWFEEWKTKLLNILSDTKNALLLIGTVLLLKLVNEYESLENTIKKWYENAKKEVKEIWDKIELANTVLSLSELAVIALIDVKTAWLLKNLGLNFLVPDYSGLNESGKDGNLDLISVIQKMYEFSRNVNDFMAGGAVSIDNNIYFGSLQKSSGFDEALQPDTSAFKWGKAITDAALLVTGAAGFVIGGLGEAGGVALNATGIGAAIGIPLSVESAVLMGAGETLVINSSRNLVNDGFNLMSGEGKASNEGADNLKPESLLDELAKSGVKYNPDDVVAVTKTADGKLVWLENGNSNAGLEHIMNHADDFAAQGISKDEISNYVMDALKNGKIVDYQGRGTGRPIYEFIYNGEVRKVAITTGNNGFVVGANPVSTK